MNGFKDNVISILRDNLMLHGEALGCLLASERHDEARRLYAELVERKLPIARKMEKQVFYYDYVVITAEFGIQTLIAAFSSLSENGIIILEIPNDFLYDDRYVSKFANFTGTKIKFGREQYLVIHSGVDYGN